MNWDNTQIQQRSFWSLRRWRRSISYSSALNEVCTVVQLMTCATLRWASGLSRRAWLRSCSQPLSPSSSERAFACHLARVGRGGRKAAVLTRAPARKWESEWQVASLSQLFVVIHVLQMATLNRLSLPHGQADKHWWWCEVQFLRLKSQTFRLHYLKKEPSQRFSVFDSCRRLLPIIIYS